MLAPDCIEVAELLIACAKAGIIRVGLNIRLSARENAHLVDDSQPEYLIVPEAFSYKAEEALKLSTHQPKLIGIGDSHDFPLDYESQIEQHLMKGEFRQTPAEVIMLCYTTGSTGLPKGAVYEHDKLLRSIMYTALCEFGATQWDIGAAMHTDLTAAGCARQCSFIGQYRIVMAATLSIRKGMVTKIDITLFILQSVFSVPHGF